MSEVYSNSFCNISAAAPDSEHSMLGSRNYDTFWQDDMLKGQDTWKYLIHDQDFRDIEVSRGHINTSAWVFHGRLLSTRTLHFSELQLSWQCRKKEAMEMYLVALPDDM